MDRRNGGNSLAPPRPPKLLPRVHRPRAPEPTIMSETTAAQAIHTVERATTTSANSAVATTTTQCAHSPASNSLHHQILNNSSSSGHTASAQQQFNSIINTTTTATTTNFQNRSNGSGNGAVLASPPLGDFDDYQIHHLTFLPQRPSSLSRNSSHVSSSSSSSVTAATSFTRRRPVPLTPGAAVPLLTIAGSSGSSNSSTSTFLSHFHNADPVPASPVTLAQPRPESERLTNEYVETPLRTAHQLQHATRTQHPAGQHDNGQTTTHHLLLLPQREFRQHNQHHQQAALPQQQQHQQHSSRVAGTAGSATAAPGTDGTDSFLHSHNQNHKSSATTATSTCPHTGKVTPTLPPRGFASPGVQPITQPITKQPASSTAHSTCKYAKELNALDDLLDMHHISTRLPSSQGAATTINGASPLGRPILIDGAPAALNAVTCPRCDKCRCEQCQGPRPLPQTWVCNKTCLCSAESVIDYATCLCCAKALFYHCARDNDMDCDDGASTPCVDNPCSCGPYKRTQRWGWLGAMSLVLPCLWCYWPMRGCVTLCEKIYDHYAGRGCRCHSQTLTSSMLPIIPLTVSGNSTANNGSGSGEQTAGSPLSQGSSKSADSFHSHHHNECSAPSRILRKGDNMPEKRLLDASVEY